MVRKMLLVPDAADEKPTLLSEVPAANEAQLQERIKSDPDLLPVDEYGMIGPLMVIGRETSLPSGSVDLVALARSGELLIIEFKTGPQNTDFRAALAQLIDYGSDLWRLTVDEFQATVPVRYFGSSRCQDARTRGKASLSDAARAIWPGFHDEEWASLSEQLEQQLTTGGFHYLLVAQRFTPTIQRTIEYLNTTSSAARFYAVECVRFDGAGVSAFQSRTVVGPSSRPPGPSAGKTTSEAQFLAKLPDDDYRDALAQFFEFSKGQQLRLDWGAKGVSIRMPVSDKHLTIAWAFLPGDFGFLGLRNVGLGFDSTSAVNLPTLTGVLEDYEERIGTVPGATTTVAAILRAYQFSPEAFLERRHELQEIMANLVQQANAAQ